MVQNRPSLAVALVWLALLTICTSLPGLAAEHQRGRSGETERRRVETARASHDGSTSERPNRRSTDAPGGAHVQAENAAKRTEAKSAEADKAAEKTAAGQKVAAQKLPQMKGMGPNQRAKTLSDAGFTQTKVGQNAAKNETWNHPDGSEVRVHPYGDVRTGPYKSGNNAHLHKEHMRNKRSRNERKFNDRGMEVREESETHIGLPNPRDLPAVRGRPHGS